MIWTLLLGHLIADYPLQNNAMVDAKRHLCGLSIHVLIHFFTLLALTWGLWGEVWIYLVVLTIAHFAIDVLKNVFFKYRPRWVIGPYFFDQFLHLVSIIMISNWSASNSVLIEFNFNQQFGVYAAGFLLATHVWFITERVIYYKEPSYVDLVTAQHWPRMLIRGGILLVFSTISSGLQSVISLGIVFAGLEYPPLEHKKRILLIDVSVPLVIAILIRSFL